MAKLGNSAGVKKTDLSNIILKENVRKTYDKIEERARSIEKLTQLGPIIVQESKEFPGKFDLVSGHCRYYAHEFLVKEGKTYTQIEYVIKTGDRWLIQMTENIHRSDLKPIELENALKSRIDQGKKPQQIADELSKSISWVCDRLKAQEIRSSIKEDTSGISSSGISQLRKLSPEEIKKAIPEIKVKGGTVKSVKEVIEKIKDNNSNHPAKKSSNVPGKTPYITDPETDPYTGLYGQLRLLRRLDMNIEDILSKTKKYLDGFK